jgi:hypothetical protein
MSLAAVVCLVSYCFRQGDGTFQGTRHFLNDTSVWQFSIDSSSQVLDETTTLKRLDKFLDDSKSTLFGTSLVVSLAIGDTHVDKADIARMRQHVTATVRRDDVFIVQVIYEIGVFVLCLV